MCFYRMRRIDSELLIVWALIAVTSLIYMVYPPQAKMTPRFFAEIGFVFVASPLFWILICDYILRSYRLDTIKNFFFWCTLASLFSVVVFYYLFLNYGAEAVSVFMANDQANVVLDPAQATFGATMHVFGSLIFIGPAFIASETLGLGRKAVIVAVLAIVAVLSGRTHWLPAWRLGIAIYALSKILEVGRGKLTVLPIMIFLIVIGIFLYRIWLVGSPKRR